MDLTQPGGLTQSLCYDNLNRLKQASVGAGSCNPASSDHSYDARGNFTNKVGVGSYLYIPGSNRIASVNGNTYNYNYDNNGSITTVTGSTPRTVSYTYFNVPKQIIEGSNTVGITYGPDQNRIKRSTAQLLPPRASTKKSPREQWWRTNITLATLPCMK
jgi:hypothetical protein